MLSEASGLQQTVPVAYQLVVLEQVEPETAQEPQQIQASVVLALVVLVLQGVLANPRELVVLRQLLDPQATYSACHQQEQCYRLAVLQLVAHQLVVLELGPVHPLDYLAEDSLAILVPLPYYLQFVNAFSLDYSNMDHVMEK